MHRAEHASQSSVRQSFALHVFVCVLLYWCVASRMLAGYGKESTIHTFLKRCEARRFVIGVSWNSWRHTSAGRTTAVAGEGLSEVASLQIGLLIPELCAQ